MALIKTNARSSSQLDATILTGNLPAINGSALTNISAGKIAQIVQTVKTPVANSTSGSSFVTPSGASVDITPSATSSKVLVTVQGGGTRCPDDGLGYFTIYRDSTNLGDSTKGFQKQYNDERTDQPLSMQYLDSPSSTSAITYAVYYKASAGTIYLQDTDSGNLIITAMEVLA